MRNIITPVKYEASTEEDSLDSLSGAAVDDNYVNNNEGSSASLHHISIKGVPVLPSRIPDPRKLTETHWQPPTNGRQYDKNYSKRGSSKHHSQRSKHSEKQQADDHERQPADPYLAGDRRVCTASSTTAAACVGPSIVKHQPSSSRRLLNQLARLRRLSEPNYRVRRPEKVAQVEALIEQLERATVEWEQDDLLLDRAESRDWPAQYYQRFGSTSAPTTNRSDKPTSSCRRQVSGTSETQVNQAVDFGHRLYVDPFEANEIAKSHSSAYRQTTRQRTMTPEQHNTWSAGCSGGRQRRPSRQLPSAFADRYSDDLAVRRLSRSPSASTRAASSTSLVYSQPEAQMSYLLCSNAYTPSMKGAGNPLATWDTEIEQRARADDLHYRSVKSKLEPHEPPFGIPRQQQVVYYNSADTQDVRVNNRPAKELGTKRSESKVSFVDRCMEMKKKKKTRPVGEDRDSRAGCASADSGVVGGFGSPSVSGGRQSTASSRLTPTPTSPHYGERIESPLNQRRPPIATSTSHQQSAADYAYVDEDDIAQEVDLDEELARANSRLSQVETDPGRSSALWSAGCESPAVELYTAEYRATPVRRRPKINIENPKSKSPLLKVSTGKKPPVDESRHKTISARKEEEKAGFNRADTHTPVQVQCYTDILKRNNSSKLVDELECQYDFNDDDYDDDDDDDGYIDTGEVRRAVRTTTLEPSDSSMNESSLERLNYRGGQSRQHCDDNNIDVTRTNNKATQQSHKTDSTTTKKASNTRPLFSIGEYKPLNKPGSLKIL